LGQNYGRRERTVADEALLKGLGAVISRERAANDWTADKLAKRSGLTGNTIAALEAGEQEPTWANLRRLARGLGMELEDLNEQAILLAPGPGGNELRRDLARARSARKIDLEAVTRKTEEEEERERRRDAAEGRALWLEEMEGREG
jgi:transcriptional regulator with XRE-family HTH domain